MTPRGTDTAMPDDKLIKQIARGFAKSYNGLVDPEDIAQELRLWWLSNPEYVERYLGEGADGQRKLAKSLKNAAATYCETERKHHSVPSTEFDPDVIRRLLREPAWDEKSDEFVGPLAYALERLSHEDLTILRLFHTEHRTDEDVAVQLSISVRTARARESRAIERLIERLLKTPRSGLGSRSVISNSAAVFLTNNDLDRD
jgi:RNA polymerase sigma factor (sigma-70 family)